MPLRALMAVLAPPLCAACGVHAAELEPLCARCRAGLRWLPDVARVAGIAVWAPLGYEGPARAVVRALKFRGALRVADAMAAQIAVNAPPGALERGRLVPVPLHPSRRRRRGYNQAERLAVAIASRTGLAVRDCLERSGPASTQVGRDRSERLHALAGAVAVRRGAVVPRRAILVDDVVTTGGTVAACAEALRAAGASEVSAVAYARTPGR